MKKIKVSENKLEELLRDSFFLGVAYARNEVKEKFFDWRRNQIKKLKEEKS